MHKEGGLTEGEKKRREKGKKEKAEQEERFKREDEDQKWTIKNRQLK